MGYGFGGFLLAGGLILALAIQDSINGVDLVMVGWICAGVGALLLAATAATQHRTRQAVSTTTHRDGTQTVQENRSDI